MAQAIRASLLASAMAATLVGRRANSAVSQGRCLVPDLGIADDGECTGHEQAAQIAVTLFADAAEPVLAPCAWRKLNPGISVMESAQDWATKNVSGAIDGARDRCIFLQG